MKQNRFGQAAIFKPHEIKKIRAAFNSKHRAIFEIALFTGERIGAICRLRVSDVFDESGAVREKITFIALHRKACAGKRETRQVAIHPDLRSFLEGMKLPKSEYLFPSTDMTKPISYDSVYQYWQVKFAELGLDHRGFSCHSTRRWFITNLIRNGVDIRTVQAITGHKSTRVLLNYVDTDERVSERAIATLQI